MTTIWLWLPAIPAVYGLHRLALWLEARGHIYYIHTAHHAGSGGGFQALHKIVEPGVEHVLTVTEQTRTEGEDGAPGGPPRPVRFGSNRTD